MNKRQTIKIQMANGADFILARIIAPGLAIHEINRGSLMAQELVWGITHIPSGLQITHTRTQSKAAKIARALATVTDWSKIEKDKLSTDLRRKVVDAIASVV